MPPQTPWTPHQTLAQFRAIAWLRWRILLNGLHRKGGAGELVGRLIVYPILAAISLVPTLGAGAAAWYFASHEHLARISWLLWAAFILCQLLNINLGRSGTTFNPNELIRFPVHLRSFVAIRLFFGLLAPANVLVSLMSLAIAIGVGIALPSLWFVALLALAVFAAANVLFTRMIFAWVDRWLSTRRAREIFTLLIFTVSLGFQWANVNFNPAYNHHRSHASHYALTHQRVDVAMRLYHRAHPLLVCLPPELTGSALAAMHQHRPLVYLGDVFGTALFAAAFLAIFAARMRTEFRGEVLSDVANAVAPVRKTPRKIKSAAEVDVLKSPAGVDVLKGRDFSPAINAAQSTRLQPLRESSGLHPSTPLDPSTSSAPARPRSTAGILFAKEILYLRRNVGFLYGLIVPVVMVFLFAGRMTTRSGSAWILPGAIAYTLISIMPLSYNTFGLEGQGVQFYFLAPIRLRDVFLAKNLLSLLLALIEMAVVLGAVLYLSGRQPIQLIALTLLWALATLLIGLTLGNLRSVSAPKKIEFSRAAGKQASPLSAFMSMGVLLILALLGAALVIAARLLHLNWLLLPVFAALLALALLVYILGLKQLERYTLDHREDLFSVLSKL